MGILDNEVLGIWVEYKGTLFLGNKCDLIWTG